MSALAQDWLDTLHEHEPAGHVESQSTPAVARLEGVGLCFLCSPDVSIRRAAWDFLTAIRHLGTALDISAATGEQSRECSLLAPDEGMLSCLLEPFPCAR